MTYTTTIRIKTDKRGKKIAHYWGRARRWLPLSVEAAELAIATGRIFSGPAVDHNA